MKLLVMLSYLLDLVWSFDPVPDGTYGSDRTSGLLKIVDDWIYPDTRSSIESTYGPIANWDTSGVTNMNYLFAYKTTFNANISEWDVSNVENMAQSTFQFFFVLFNDDDLSSQFFPFFFLLCSKIPKIRLSHLLTAPLFSSLSLFFF